MNWDALKMILSSSSTVAGWITVIDKGVDLYTKLGANPLQLRKSTEEVNSFLNSVASKEDIALVRSELRNVQQKIDEAILIRYRVGIESLITGLTSTLPEIKSDELRRARAEFVYLTQLDPKGHTIGTSGIIENVHLIAAGYLGNHYYFLLNGDLPSALLQVYQCGIINPSFAVKIFDSKFFSSDYASPLLRLERAVWHLGGETSTTVNKTDKGTAAIHSDKVALHRYRHELLDLLETVSLECRQRYNDLSSATRSR